MAGVLGILALLLQIASQILMPAGSVQEQDKGHSEVIESTGSCMEGMLEFHVHFRDFRGFRRFALICPSCGKLQRYLNEPLRMLRLLIFDRRVDGGISSLAAAPMGP
jgi:hypothetical protein